MDTINYADNLPKPGIDSADAIEALVDKIPIFERDGLFRSDEFVQAFNERFSQIVDNLPKDTRRKPLEIELAYIVRGLETRHGLIMSGDLLFAKLRSIENMLEDAGVLDQYVKFGKGFIQEIDIEEGDLFKEYLDYLYLYGQLGLRHTQEYLETCIHISQVEGGVDMLMDHLGFIFSQIPREAIDYMLTEHDYLGGKEGDFDKHTESVMAIEPTLSRSEAETTVMNFQNDAAAFHIMLADLYNKNILPYMEKISLEQNIMITSRLNDFRDIVDPEGYIPLYFHNGNWLETLMRDQIQEDGREVH